MSASMTNDGGPAFPVSDEGQGWGSTGMSLRDWFAGQIAAGMAAHSGTSGVSFGPHDIAGRSYQVADALLKARDGVRSTRASEGNTVTRNAQDIPAPASEKTDD